MRFGLALPHYDYSLPGAGNRLKWAWVRDWAQRAEELGFSSVWISDHLFLDLERYGGSAEQSATIECFTALSALAPVTRSVRLGALVLCNDLRNPALVAKMASSLGVISDGRSEIGIGSGWYEREYEAAGIPFDSAGIRISRLEEAVQIIRTMMTEGRATFSGRYYEVEDALDLPIPPRSRIWVGGKGDRTVALAGRWADGYNAVWSWEPADYRERIRVLERSASRKGRDPATIARSVGLYVLHGRDGAELEERWERYAGASPVNVAVSMNEWAPGKLFGTTEQVSERIEEFAGLGVEEVILGFGILPFQVADESAVDLFAREVFPRSAT